MSGVRSGRQQRSDFALSRYATILLDVNSTFMFGEDRFGPDHDYFATYRALGGSRLAEHQVRSVIDSCVEEMLRLYEDSSRCDDFPSVRDVLGDQPTARDLAPGEHELIESVIARHELGSVPIEYADGIRALARTHRLGVVSNIWSRRGAWIAEFGRVGILELFEEITFSSDGRTMKPSPAIFTRTLKRMRLAHSEVVFIGDSLRCDIGGAAAAGLATIWIDREGRGARSEGPQPDWIIGDLLDIC